MTVKHIGIGNRTIINVERRREIYDLLERIRPKENDLMSNRFWAELKELSIWHDDTVPEDIYFATIFRDEIIPAQVAHIEANAGMRAKQLMPGLIRIAERIAGRAGELDYRLIEFKIKTEVAR